MPGLLSATMKTQLARSNASVFPLFEADWPFTGTQRLSSISGGVASVANGQYDPRVISFGKTKILVPDKNKSIQTYSKDVAIWDPDYSFMSRVGQGHRLDYTAGRVYWASANVPQVSWFQSFGGLLKGWSVKKPLEVTLTYGPPETALKQNFNRILYNQYDWPNADKTCLGKYAPIIYGMVDDSGYFDSGAAALDYVDTVGFRYMVSVGWVTPIRVYKGNAIASTSTWSTQHVVVNGIPYTLVVLTGSAGTTAVTADVVGIESVGNGTGTLVRGVGILQHLLVNFVFNPFKGGLWQTGLGAAPLNTAKWTAVANALAGRCNGGPYDAGRIINDLRTGEQECNDFCTTHHLDMWWDNLGLLCIGLDDPNASPSASADIITYPAQQLEAMGLDAKDDNMAAGCVGLFSQFNGNSSSAAPQGYKRGVRIDPPLYDQLEVDDPLSGSPIVDQVSMTYHPMSTP